MSPTCKRDIYSAQTDVLRLEMRPNDSFKGTAVKVTQPCSMCSVNQDVFGGFFFAPNMIGCALRFRRGFKEIVIHSALFHFMVRKRKGGKLSLEHLSRADVESEDNKSSDSALTCKSHQPALVSDRRR